MTTPSEEPTIRDEITSAFDAAEKPPEEPKGDVPPADAPKTEEPPKVEEPKPEEAPKDRGTDGRFLKKEEKPEEPKVEAKKPEELKVEEPKVEKPKLNAPGTWGLKAKEKWGDLPEDIQREVLKRERDIANGFNEVTRVKQFGQNMHDLWSPFQGIIAAEGGDAMAMTRNLFTTAAALYNGTPQQKVNVINGMIRTFNVDIAMLDSALAASGGAGGGPPQPDMNTIIRREIQTALAPITQSHQAQQARLEQDVATELEEFIADPKNEFYDRVRDSMADMMEMYAKRGQKLSLQEAYNKCTMMDNEIAEVLQERALRDKAAKATAAAAAAKKKAVSVTGAPARELPQSSESNTLREDILNAIESRS